MININYQKRKNTELFKSLEGSDSLFLSKTQNYIPIYKRFFSLNDTNFNTINLNHKWHLSSIQKSDEEDAIVYNGKIKNINNNKVKEKEIFFKLAPLLDPYKFLIGKYNLEKTDIFHLPTLDSDELNTHPKFIDNNNCAYVDSFFFFLSSNLIYNHHFVHGVDFYGSFLAIKHNFHIDVADDIDYLNNSVFFNKHKNVLFQVDEYEYLFQEETIALKPITIQHDTSVGSKISIKSFDNEPFEDIFQENILAENRVATNNELIEITDIGNHINSKSITLKSNSTCSSRSSYTSDGDIIEPEGEESEKGEGGEGGEGEEEDVWEDEEEEEEEEERINVTIPKFPVQVICMEYCENTFDELILNNELTEEEWLSAFMQIIMILITYQKAFHFTHNDLHTNNIMYNSTEKKFIYYLYKGKHYKVPTFGRIFKIIDFGRSIYKFNGNLFCSDSFQIGGDASTQYNTEPYFNDKKPRLEPNFSFDLCRLACSIFDYIIEDFNEIKDLTPCTDPIKRLIIEWCLDDKGINMLYKQNGVDRYPEFKLYKMIARCVHNHTPQSQLERPEFKKFEYTIKETQIQSINVMNIDEIPVYV